MFDEYGEFKRQLPDRDPTETQDWTDSLDSVARNEGADRAQFILYRLLKRARQLQLGLPALTQTRYINTISPEQEPPFPGDEEIEHRIRRMVRWNAVAMVLRANNFSPGIGGHLATYASAATLYEVGFNHFFRGKDAPGMGDHIFYQGHAAPGMYARAFLEGRLSADQLDHFRREVVPGTGLSSYPHPRLMPDFWEFPTVSMGLGPLAAIYQARFDRYLAARGLKDTSANHTWAFLGDGEMDEPEALAGLSLAGRDGLDNLTFVVNCNLQRLDGPVRGNGKIVQELEGLYRGAGWNVIKVIWGREWDELLARDEDGVLVHRMNETLDGEFQKFSVESGAYIREHFFGPDPRLQAMVAHLSDDELTHLRRGGHDIHKVYAAYQAALAHKGAPTVVLAKTVKGWTLGAGVEARNITHQAKKLSEAELKVFRDRLELPIPDDKLKDAPYYHPGPRAPEIEYLAARRAALGGPLPRRVVHPVTATLPGEPVYAEFMAGSGTQEASTTMAFAKLLRNLLRDPGMGKRIVPIVPDEARTFGMDPLFREVGIYAARGQLYDPVDSELVLSYREARDGQVLEEGITEAGAAASFQAAGISYATHAEPVIPFYIFYSMFGFQRTGDQFWAIGDARARGFLLGATAGRTTLNGEGLQHEDGHSLLLASTVPSVRAYDPAFAYETALIIRDGLRRMLEEHEDLVYYLTLYNENHVMPALAPGIEDGVVRGLYRFREAPPVSGKGKAPRATILASGSLMQEALRAPDAAGRAVRCRGRRVERDLVPAAACRRARGRALEPPASRRAGPRAVRHRAAGRGRGARARRGGERLHEGCAGPDRPLGARRQLGRPRHGRLRPQRHAGRTAALLRDRCRARRPGGGGRTRPVRPTRCGRGPPGAGEPGRRRGGAVPARRLMRRRPGVRASARLLGGTAVLLALMESQAPPALGHSIVGRFPSPLPLGAYLAGAAVAVALSFSLVLTREPITLRTGPVRTRHVPALLRAFLRLIGLIGWGAVLLETVLVAQPGDADVGSLFLWVYGWVGLAVLSALVGPVWTWLDPFDSLARGATWLVHRAGFEGPRPASYPARLGRWPALAGYAYFVWLELAVTNGGGGRYLGLSLAGYTVVTLAGMLVYGRSTWRSQAETFSVWFELLGRLAPLALDGPPEDARVRVRGYARGLIRAVWTGPEVAFVALAVAGVIFDGLSQTTVWFQAFGAASVATTTIWLAVFTTIIVLAALLATRVAGRAAIGAGLVPIAVGYILAHYLTFLLIDGQRIILVFDDPLSLGNHFLGLAGWAPSGAWLPPPLVWGAMLTAVVGGHMVGAIAGHASAAVEVRPDVPPSTPWTSVALGALRRRELPLAGLMVGLTVLTLWSLGQVVLQPA